MAFMRPGQHNNNNNNKRNRNRNRRHSGMGNSGGGGGGGNSANRVFDSNGPDVKLRGTAQTIAEKYMQLGRDAHSSGDSVMAESYYQFGDHYYRLWLAAQPAGQPLQFSRRLAEEEMEDEAGENGPEGDDEAPNGEANASEGGEPTASGEDGGDGPGAEAQDGQRQNRPRDNTNRDNNNREGGRNFRQRWPRRNDRGPQEGAQSGPQGSTQSGPLSGNGQPQDAAPDVQDRAQPAEQAVEAGDNWEAPSFLKRPAPAVVASEEAVADAPAPRTRRTRAVAPPEDVPQGE
jgi:hypothetical protein